MTPAAPPTEAELTALARRALDHLGPEAQVTAWWERSVQAGGGAHLERSITSVELLEVLDGRIGIATVAGSLDDGALREAAGRALAAAERASGSDFALPEPAAARAHAGYDPVVLALDPTDLVAAGRRWRAGAAKTAIVSTRGVSAYEQRSFAALTVDLGLTAQLSAAATSPAGLDPEALVAEGARLAANGEPASAPGGELAVVLGPDAVAAVLDLLRQDLAAGGRLEARRGTRVVAPCVNLSDSPRFALGLPRSYDALGVPREPVPLIQDGVAHRVVSRATGHAATPQGGQVLPEHLVLVGGGAAGVAELMEPIGRGLYLPTLESGFEIVDGRRGRPIGPARARIDALRVLATTQALGAGQRTIATRGSARTIGATVCPPLRATGGIELLV